MKRPLASNARSGLRSPKTVVVLTQNVVGVSTFQCSRDMSDPASVAGMALGGALGGAAVAAAKEIAAQQCEAQGLSEHEAAVWPVRDALLGHDPGALLGAKLDQALGPLRWLGSTPVRVHRVAEGKVVSNEIAKLLRANGQTAMLLVEVDYRLRPSFEALAITAEVTLYTGEVKQVVRMGREVREHVVAYHNVFSTFGRPRGWPNEPAPLGVAATLWGREQNARQVLDGGLAELARMIAYDVEAAGRDAPPRARPLKVDSIALKDDRGYALFARGQQAGSPGGGIKRVEGYVERREGNHAWMRLLTGELVSSGVTYP